MSNGPEENVKKNKENHQHATSLTLPRADLCLIELLVWMKKKLLEMMQIWDIKRQLVWNSQ